MSNQERYVAPITRKTPALIGILVDMSGSMAQDITINGQTMTKAYVANMFINMFIDELIARSKREEGYRNYFHFIVVGYGGEGVELMLRQIVPDSLFCSVEELSQAPVAYETYVRRDSSGQVRQFPIRRYVDIEPYHSTPMFAGFDEMYGWVREWVNTNPYSFPPIVINLTDGELTDASPAELTEKALRLRKLKTRDGEVLLFNIHIASSEEGHQMLFPLSKREVPPLNYAHLLYDISSSLPARFREEIARHKEIDLSETEDVRAVSFNADMLMLLDAIVIGTNSVTKFK